MTILWQVRRMVFLAGVLMLPMLADGGGCFDEPSTVFDRFENVRRGEILGGVLGGIAKRLEQPSSNQCGDVMRLAVQHPARLLRREAGGQLSQERQEPQLIFVHAKPVAADQWKRTGIFRPLTALACHTAVIPPAVRFLSNGRF